MRYTGINDHGTFYEAREPWLLNHFDRRDLSACREYCLALGYDRVVVDRMGSYDSRDVVEIVCICRRGEVWATWMCARNGDTVIAWSALTGEDAGFFLSLSEAMHSVLLRDPRQKGLCAGG
jgi:hypothetical protein